MSNLVNDFDRYLTNHGYAKATRASYCNPVRHLVNCTAHDLGKTPVEISQAEFDAYIADLAARVSIKSTTKTMSALRKFYRWARASHLCDDLAKGIVVSNPTSTQLTILRGDEVIYHRNTDADSEKGALH